MIAFVLLLTFVLLTVVFRSVVVAGTAVGLNLLSVGAAYGLLVLVFQEGVGADLLGFQQTDAIEAWVPLFLFSVLFGLSMDYQVFLLSRIRERYDQSGDTTDAVTFGVGSTARIITGAALIIVAVFSGFARGDLIMFQQMGFGVAIALLIDATIIRSVLLPSAMKLLGDWNWYLPRRLEWLPRLQLEEPAQPAPPQASPRAADPARLRLLRVRRARPSDPRARGLSTSGEHHAAPPGGLLGSPHSRPRSRGASSFPARPTTSSCASPLGRNTRTSGRLRSSFARPRQTWPRRSRSHDESARKRPRGAAGTASPVVRRPAES